ERFGLRGAALSAVEVGQPRRCLGLRYCSQRKPKEDRATRPMLKIVRRLDPNNPDPCNDLPEMSKGMHWGTYDRLGGTLPNFNIGERRSCAALADISVRRQLSPLTILMFFRNDVGRKSAPAAQ